MMKNFITISIILFTSVLFAQTGPGGIGTTDGTSDLVVWLNANDLDADGDTTNNPSNGSAVQDWNNLSGYAFDYSQTTISEQASYETSAINGYSACYFDGSDSFTSINNSYQRGTALFVLNASDFSAHSRLLDNQHTSGAGKTSLRFEQWNNTGNLGFTRYSVLDYDSGITTPFDIDAILSFSKRTNSSNIRIRKLTNGSLNNTNLNVVANTATIPIYELGDLIKGNISEVIVYKKPLNKVQRIITDNYLSAKYGLVLQNDDFYTQDNPSNGNFDHHVAGIGQDTAIRTHSDSQGTGIIRINTPSALADDDYLFWGEETKNPIYDFSTASDYKERLNSKWRVSKLNDLGTVTLSIDGTKLDLSGMQSCATSTFKLIVSSNANFSIKTSYDLTLSSGNYEATSVTFNDGDYFTLEYQDKIVVDGTKYYNGSGFMEVPNTFDGCYKFLVKSTADGLLPMTQGANVREVEVETNGILTINSGLRLTVESSIQLDGDIRLFGTSQLLQTHSGTSQVTGNGKLYLDRKSDLSNVYQSGYWTSPVTTTGNTFTVGDAMKDGTTPTSATSTPPNITFVSTYDGATTSPITISNFWLAKLTDDLDWDRHRSETTVHNPTEGYNMKSSGLISGQNFTFVGKPNDGDYTSSITSGNSSLLGNPYPSALDGDVFISNNQAIFNTLYFWDGINDTSNSHNGNSYLGGYATRVISMGTPFNSGTTPGRYISVGQGFFVDAIASGTINFKNSQRAFASGSTYKNIAANNFPILRLGFEFDIENNNTYHRQLAIGFRGLTNNYEPAYDAIMYDMRASDISLKVNNHASNFVIAGIEDFSENIEIPLHIILDQQRNVTFNIDSVENFSPNVYLKDNTNNHFYNLANTVTLNLPIGNFTNRFSITFRNSTLSTNNLSNNTEIIVIDNFNNLSINSLNNIEIKNVSIFNILGQTIINKKVNGATIVNLPIQIKKGHIILVKVELTNGQIKIIKLIKK